MNYGMEDPSSMGMNMGMSGMTGLGNDRLLLRLRRKKHLSHIRLYSEGKGFHSFLFILPFLIIIIPYRIGQSVAMTTLTVLVD